MVNAEVVINIEHSVVVFHLCLALSGGAEASAGGLVAWISRRRQSANWRQVCTAEKGGVIDGRSGEAARRRSLGVSSSGRSRWPKRCRIQSNRHRDVSGGQPVCAVSPRRARFGPSRFSFRVGGDELLLQSAAVAALTFETVVIDS